MSRVWLQQCAAGVGPGSQGRRVQGRSCSGRSLVARVGAQDVREASWKRQASARRRERGLLIWDLKQLG